MTSAFAVVVQTEQFEFLLSNSDLFVNQAIRCKVALAELSAHGLLGQTHSYRIHSSALKFIEGDVDDYIVANSNIFGDDFVFNRFQL
jgi:hypothetical protein